MRVGVIGIVAPILLAVACADPTQLVLKVTTDLPCTEVGKVEIRVAHSTAELDTAAAQITEATTCTSGSLGSLVIIPDKDDKATVFIRALLSKGTADCTPPGANCIVGNAIVAFSPGTSVDVPIALTASCKGVSCSAGQTCAVGGTCVSAQR